MSKASTIRELFRYKVFHSIRVRYKMKQKVYNDDITNEKHRFKN